MPGMPSVLRNVGSGATLAIDLDQLRAVERGVFLNPELSR